MPLRVLCFLILLVMPVLPVYGENAADYFDLGLKSTTTRAKIKYFSKALELDPTLAEAYEQRGMLYFFQEKFEYVIEDFQSYIQLAPPKAEAYRMLGMGFLKIGDHRSAIEHCTRAIAIDPGSAAAYTNRAEAYFRAGDDQNAIEDATRAIELGGDPKFIADAYRTRAKAYRNTGRNEQAVADVRSSWQTDPRYAHYMRAVYGYASPEALRKSGLIAIIGIAFVLIFKLKLKPPEKDD